jgi:hypothetical protein
MQSKEGVVPFLTLNKALQPTTAIDIYNPHALVKLTLVASLVPDTGPNH